MNFMRVKINEGPNKTLGPSRMKILLTSYQYSGI
jgi:hypothetical protein